ncbi:hypothetical protein V6N13_028472 [Hibiscus sabdariffa]
MLNDGVEDLAFNFNNIWSLFVPPKVRSFLWMLYLKRIPTIDFLLKRGISIEESKRGCPWCGIGVESADHVLFSCGFMCFFWSKFCCWWKVSWPSVSSIEEAFGFLFSTLTDRSVQTPWLSSFAAAL